MGKVCGCCGFTFSVWDFKEAYRRAKWSVKCYFLALCPRCRSVLVMQFVYASRGSEVRLRVVQVVESSLMKDDDFVTVRLDSLAQEVS